MMLMPKTRHTLLTERYDIVPSNSLWWNSPNDTGWAVVDTGNRNTPMSYHETREKALAEAIKLDGR